MGFLDSRLNGKRQIVLAPFLDYISTSALFGSEDHLDSSNTFESFHRNYVVCTCIGRLFPRLHPTLNWVA